MFVEKSVLWCCLVWFDGDLGATDSSSVSGDWFYHSHSEIPIMFTVMISLDFSTAWSIFVILLLFISEIATDTIKLGYLAGELREKVILSNPENNNNKSSYSGNKQRDGQFNYETPGLRISGALSLAVKEANERILCCGHK